ncbi:MAG: DNA mismatch repair protein MutS [Opitutae bacterium]|nr:DNA mismatch repair protein MutS [Opitutae bacterium]
MSGKKDTPMMIQYREARQSLPKDTVLLFRLGDFYELFERDAEVGAAILGITLTKRHDMPMAGIPFHAVDNYVTKLLDAGKKVAFCDQVETAQPGKLVKRALTRILTPGTALEERQMEADQNHFLLAFDLNGSGLRASWLDLSTGKFVLTAETNASELLSVFASLAPKEYIVPEGWSEASFEDEEKRPFFQELEMVLGGATRTERAGYEFETSAGAREVMEALGVLNLEGFGISADHPGLGPAGALLSYSQDALRSKPGNLRRIEEYCSDNTLLLDPATLRNLEIFRTSSNQRKGSLLDTMDETVTAGGARLLEDFLARPEVNLDELRRRQQCVTDFHGDSNLTEQTRERLRSVSDLQRILGRLRNRLARPRELGGILGALHQLPDLKALFAERTELEVTKVSDRLGTFDGLRDLLSRGLAEELPADLRDGGVIREAFDEDLDQLRELSAGGKTWLSELEESEREKTGIKNLRIKYNGAFGYFIEVSKSNIPLVPEHYVRKQTLTNVERYFTEDLQQKEKEIINAEERAIVREEEIFRELVEAALEEAEELADTAAALAELDLFAAWAFLARDREYCRPDFREEGDLLEIEQGRHPVVELSLRSGGLGLVGTHAFVPNDCNLTAGEEQIALITGPNMAGKSTYIRQVALIVLMAQVGSWVPARRCALTPIDRIFSRVGASDELARGNSTFMVEMNETANILNNCSERSLIILDEIGRGTSTYDGLSIAWAVAEHLHGAGEAGPKTLFATHYHELTKLSDTLPRLRNFSVAVKEWNDEIIFVRQVIPGAADRSYGIQVARLAGIPDEVISRAKDILDGLENPSQKESKKSSPEPAPPKEKAPPNPKPDPKPLAPPEETVDSGQMELF